MKIYKKNLANQLKKEIASFMQRLYLQKLTTTSGGNISVLLDDENILITSSGTDKGTIKASDIVQVNRNNEFQKSDSKLKVSIEYRMHLAIFAARPDVRAIVHAHPPTASAISASKVKIREDLIAETRAVLGKIGYAEYKPMGSKELAEEVAKIAKHHDAIIMKNHGAICVGKNLLQAFDRLEVLEAAAQMTTLHLTALKDSTVPLSPLATAEFDKMRENSK